MGTRLRHRLRKLFASGALVMPGRQLPAWIYQAVPPAEEAAPGEVQEYLTRQEPERVEMPRETSYVVGVNKKSGTILFSGEGCLGAEWNIIFKGTREECCDHVKTLRSS